MRRFVNGDEVELHLSGVEIFRNGDRWMVRTSEGVFSALAVRRGSVTYISFKGRQFAVEERRSRVRIGAAQETGEIRAPMPGQIVDIRIEQGAAVAKGATLLVLEAMKTQQPFVSPFEGIVTGIFVSKGDQVEEGAVLAMVHPHEKNDA